MFHDVLRIRLFSLPSAPHSLFDWNGAPSRHGRGRFEFEMVFESMRVDLHGGELCCENAFRPRYVNGRSSRRAQKSALNFGLLLSSRRSFLYRGTH